MTTPTRTFDPTRIELLAVTRAEQFQQALALRYEVFCDEQGVPRDIEHDAEDALAFHVLAHAEGQILATGRVLRQRTDGSLVALSEGAQPGDRARVGRMAVARRARGLGLGAQVLERLERQAFAAGLAEALLHAQTHAEGFYEKAGYRRHGPEFDEAGIVHVEMLKPLR